jgi:hypothetical protein
MFRIRYDMTSTFRLQCAYTYVSEFLWHDLYFLSPQDDQFSGMSVQPLSLLNVSAQKWMWNRRIRLGLLFYNCLNRPVQYLPESAAYDLSVFFNMAFRLHAGS